MNVKSIEPGMDTGALLAGAQFADAFRITVDDAALDARLAAEKMLTRNPRWIEVLMRLRNRLVAPIGLKTPVWTGAGTRNTVGIFPVMSETPDRLVAGFDDKHLDFRIVVDVAACGTGRNVTATTLVLTHNLLGRAYLAIILPFHRRIVRAMLRQVAR